MLFAVWSWVPPVWNVVVLLLGIFLILLVLIQRGKGGGLAGAFGGAGGSSPFGSRAGDTFTRITIFVATFWILLTMVQVKVVQGRGDKHTETGESLSTLPGSSETPPQTPAPR
ncbi:MAG TPA: preprotein translocase subunit SecG [Gemmataceae bacterium]|nr:preprotein translocase subunit SecG [Gemmataceae bacterium]